MPIGIVSAQNEISGFGHDVKKIVDKRTGEVLAYLGVVNGVPHLHFPKPLPLSILGKLAHDLAQFNRSASTDSSQRP
jgi:hypothetical protein